MKTSYFLVVLLALTLLLEDVDGWFVRTGRRRHWFFRTIHRYRWDKRELSCMAACRWASSWACKVCKRKRGLGVHSEELDADDLDVSQVLATLDMNGDGFVELDEIAHVTGLKLGDPVLVNRFHKADLDGDEKLDIVELDGFNFENEQEFMEAMKDDNEVSTPFNWVKIFK